MIKLDYVPATNYKIYQDDLNFKYTTDSLILSRFAKPRGICVDLGCGSGILSLRLIDKVDKFINLDANERSIEILDKSIELNQLEDKVENHNIDISNIENLIDKNSIDTVLTNPPYYKDGLRSNIKSIDQARYNENLEIFIKASNFILKDLGKIFIVLSASRMIDIFELLVKYRIEPKRVRFVKKNIDSLPKLILIEGVKYAKRGFFFENDFLLNSDGDISDELRKVYEEI